MKKQILFIILAMLVSVSAFSHDIEVQNADGVTIYYNYMNDGTELEVTYRGENQDSYFDEYMGNVVIPEEVTYGDKTRKVTSIGDWSFAFCNLTSITIGNNVTYIGVRAFYGCSRLTSVTFGNSVKHIGNGAFFRCKSLTSVTFGNNVTSLGDSAFIECSKLASITIPNSMKHIGNQAFRGCKSLTTITIPNSVEDIGHTAFGGCFSLASVTIGNGVKRIGHVAFNACSGLKKVIVKDIAAWCGIEFVVSSLLGSNPLSWAHHLYSDEDTEITNLIIPNSVTSIGSGAFEYCSGLTSVTIPNSVTSIGKSAFSECI